MPKIRFKRGLEANLPTLDEGEPAFTTDTEEFFIGSQTGNIEFAKQSDLNTTNANVSTNTANIATNTAAISAIGTINANAELVAARGTYPTLAPRLDNVDSSLADLANLTVFAKDFNLVGDKVTDDSTGISNAVQKALTNIPINAIQTGVVNGTHIVVEVKLPAGTFAIKNQIVIDGTQISPNLVDQIVLKVTGATEGGTVLILQNNTGIFNLNNIAVRFQDMRFSGYGYTGSAFTFGSATVQQFVSGSEFKNLRFYGFTTAIQCNLLYDSTFMDCGFFAMQGANPTAFNIIAHPVDNTNNLNFFRCHWENTTSGAFFKAVGTNSGAGYHHDINFYGCHFETRSFSANIFDVCYCQNINLHGGQLTASNSTGSGNGITLANFVPMIKMQDSNLFSLKGVMAQIQKGSDINIPTNKMIEMGGAARGLNIENSFFNNPTLTGYPSVNAIIQQTSGNALVDASMQTCKFKNFFINDLNVVPYNDYRVYLGDPDTRNHNVKIQHNTTSNEVEIAYSTDPQAQDSSFTKVFGVGKVNGIVNAMVYTGQLCQTITNGTSATLNIDSTLNANRRAVYMIYADYPGAAATLVWSNGTALTAMFTGTDAVVGNTDPGTANKLNIFLTGTGITVYNRLGSDRKVSIVPFGFR